MFSIKADFDRADRMLSDIGRKQLPFATAQALNDTGQDALEAVKSEIATSFDRPTRWTQNAFFLRRASKTRLTATIERKRPVSGKHYLEVQSKGGVRPQTGLERLMSSRLAFGGIVRTVTPASGARLNASGNWSPGQRNQVLSGVKAQRDRTSNTTAISARRNPTRAKFFVSKVGGHLPPGVYQRMARKKIKKVVHISDSSASYSKRFRFNEKAMERAQRRFEQHFVRRLRQAIATAR